MLRSQIRAPDEAQERLRPSPAVILHTDSQPCSWSAITTARPDSGAVRDSRPIRGR